MHFGRKFRQFVTMGAATCSLTIGIVATSVGATAHTGTGTITFAEAAGANPNYIFPYLNCAYASVNNINQFQWLMYRPLYWLGQGGSSAYVPSLSTARTPAFSNANKTLTITMKGWKFANGHLVDARSVMFFLNMFMADPKSYCGYSAGVGIPDQVRSASGHGNVVTIDFTTPMNPNWILYNYLSEITPMPNSWDRTGSNARGGCATGAFGAPSTKIACLAVEHYLNGLATRSSTYAGALWQSGVDGPWRLTSMDHLGNVTFQPNRHYSGPKKAMVQYVKEVAFTTTTSEETQLLAGALDVGYVEPSVLPARAAKPGVVGPNWGPLASRYRLYAGSQWNFNYAPFNFSPADPKAAAISQLYVRQALQLAVDQPSIITTAYKGYGFPIDSPLPPNTPAAISANVANPYPFNLAAAKSLLTSHGWTLVNGVMTCTSPGTAVNQCGANITLGYTLNFKVVWTSGSATLDAAFNLEIADWASIGIQFTHATDTFNNVISFCGGASGYEICALGPGWTYAPNYLPSGENLFVPNGAFNVGSYSDPKMTALINDSTHGTAKLSSYLTYAAQQLPVLFQPQPATEIEIIKSLKSTIGFAPNPLGNFMPEYYHY
jgi:peptide/nickel transport system substrate-binding protein